MSNAYTLTEESFCPEETKVDFVNTITDKNNGARIWLKPFYTLQYLLLLKNSKTKTLLKKTNFLVNILLNQKDFLK